MNSFNEIYESSKLEETFGEWHSKQLERAKKEPTVAGKVGKYIANILFGGDDWDNLSDSLIDYMNEPDISEEEKKSRINQVSSIFKKFDGRKDPILD
jgi:hypothetical protein